MKSEGCIPFSSFSECHPPPLSPWPGSARVDVRKMYLDKASNTLKFTPKGFNVSHDEFSKVISSAKGLLDKCKDLGADLTADDAHDADED